MPIPLLAIVSALAAGGTLVPHAAGGMIVNAAGGYVAGTYLSTAAISSVVAAATATLGAGAAAALGTASAIVGGAPAVVATVGTTGVVGRVAAAVASPIAKVLFPIAICGVAIITVALVGYLVRLRWKVRNAKEGEEKLFSEREAKVVQVLLLQVAKKSQPNSVYRLK